VSKIKEAREAVAVAAAKVAEDVGFIVSGETTEECDQRMKRLKQRAEIVKMTAEAVQLVGFGPQGGSMGYHYTAYNGDREDRQPAGFREAS
jgi:hypothetical protein